MLDMGRPEIFIRSACSYEPSVTCNSPKSVLMAIILNASDRPWLSIVLLFAKVGERMKTWWIFDMVITPDTKLVAALEVGVFRIWLMEAGLGSAICPIMPC